MHIEPKEYLSLLDQIEHLKNENILLKQETLALTDKLAKQQLKQIQQQQNAIRAMKVVEELHAKAIAYEIQQKEQILERVAEFEKQTKEYLQSKFASLENSSLTQVKSMELQNAKNQLDYYELSDFASKMRTMYINVQNLDATKMKKEVTLPQLTKWMKSTLPGVVASFSRTGFSTASSGTGMKKKTLNQSRFKQNKIPSSATRQRSNVHK